MAILKPILLFVALLAWSCAQKPAQPASLNPLLSYFEEVAPTDTLVLTILDSQALPGKAIPAQTFFSHLPGRLTAEVLEVIDSNDLKINGLYKINPTGGYQLCVASLEWNWWKFLLILAYDPLTDSFSSLKWASDFYGGDGGQVASCSWLVGQTLYQRYSEHSLLMEGDTAVDRVEEWVGQFQWKGLDFQSVPVSDSAALVNTFRVQWPW